MKKESNDISVDTTISQEEELSLQPTAASRSAFMKTEKLSKTAAGPRDPLELMPLMEVVEKTQRSSLRGSNASLNKAGPSAETMFIAIDEQLAGEQKPEKSVRLATLQQNKVSMASSIAKLSKTIFAMSKAAEAVGCTADTLVMIAISADSIVSSIQNPGDTIVSAINPSEFFISSTPSLVAGLSRGLVYTPAMTNIINLRCNASQAAVLAGTGNDEAINWLFVSQDGTESVQKRICARHSIALYNGIKACDTNAKYRADLLKSIAQLDQNKLNDTMTQNDVKLHQHRKNVAKYDTYNTLACVADSSIGLIAYTISSLLRGGFSLGLNLTAVSKALVVAGFAASASTQGYRQRLVQQFNAICKDICTELKSCDTQDDNTIKIVVTPEQLQDFMGNCAHSSNEENLAMQLIEGVETEIAQALQSVEQEKQCGYKWFMCREASRALFFLSVGMAYKVLGAIALGGGYNTELHTSKTAVFGATGADVSTLAINTYIIYRTFAYLYEANYLESLLMLVSGKKIKIAVDPEVLAGLGAEEKAELNKSLVALNDMLLNANISAEMLTKAMQLSEAKDTEGLAKMFGSSLEGTLERNLKIPKPSKLAADIEKIRKGEGRWFGRTVWMLGAVYGVVFLTSVVKMVLTSTSLSPQADFNSTDSTMDELYAWLNGTMPYGDNDASLQDLKLYQIYSYAAQSSECFTALALLAFQVVMHRLLKQYSQANLKVQECVKNLATSVLLLSPDTILELCKIMEAMKICMEPGEDKESEINSNAMKIDDAVILPGECVVYQATPQASPSTTMNLAGTIKNDSEIELTPASPSTSMDIADAREHNDDHVRCDTTSLTPQSVTLYRRGSVGAQIV